MHQVGFHYTEIFYYVQIFMILLFCCLEHLDFEIMTCETTDELDWVIGSAQRYFTFAFTMKTCEAVTVTSYVYIF